MKNKVCKRLIAVLACTALCLFGVGCGGLLSSGEVETGGLTFKTLTIENNEASVVVPNAVTEFSFANEVQATGNSTFQVSNDAYGLQTYLTKIVPLAEGDNKYYVFEMQDSEVKSTYTIKIRRRPIFTVAFNMQGGTEITEQEIEEGGLATMPDVTPERNGYTFVDWNFDFSTPITKNVTVTPNWTAKATGDGKTLQIHALDKGLGTQWLEQAAESFNRRNGTNITILPDGMLNERVSNLLSSKTGNADIYFTSSTERQWVEWYAGGYIYDLADIADNITYRNADYAKLGVFDGKRVTMPYSYAPTGFVYNQDYIDLIPSHGEFTKGTFPTTWQGLIDLCYSVTSKWTSNTRNAVPFTYGGSVGDIEYIFKGLWAQLDPTGFKAYYNQAPLESIDNNENKNLLVNDNVKKAIKKIVELINPQEKNGIYSPSYASQDATELSNLEAQQKFLNGFAVFTISGAWFENEMRNQIAEKFPNEEDRNYHFAPVPIAESGKQSTVYVNTPSEYFVIAKNGKSKNLTLAKAFLEYLAKPEQAQLFHATSGTPCAMQYEISTDDLTVFQAEVANVLKTSQVAIGGSDKIPSLSGVLRVDFNTMFQQLATRPLANETITNLLESLYVTQKNNWEDAIAWFL